MTGDRFDPRRRTVLKAIGSGLLAGGVAGAGSASEESTPGEEYEFTPPSVGIPERVQEELALPEPAADERRREATLTVDGVERSVTIAERSVRYGVGELRPESTDWSEPIPEARGLATFVTPRAEVAGTETNDRATVDLEEFVAEGVGPEVLFGLEEWERSPEAVAETTVETLGEETRLTTVAGIADGDGGPRVVLAHVVRVDRPAEVVFGAAVQTRRLPERFDPSDAALVGEEGPISEAALRARREFGTRTIERLRPDVEVPTPMVGLQDVSVVQRVGDSGLVDPSGGSRTMVRRMDPPDLVVGDYATVSLDLDPSELGLLPSGDRVRVEVLRHRRGRSRPIRDAFELDASDVRAIDAGTEPLAIFHDLANDRPGRAGPPVFEFDADLHRIEVRVGTGPNSPVLTESTTVDLRTAGGRDVVHCDPLRVGFVELQGQWQNPTSNSTPPWGDPNGGVMKYDESVDACVEYLDHAFPGRLTAYKFTRPVTVVADAILDAGTSNDRLIHQELSKAGSEAQKITNSTSRPGTFVTVAEDRTRSAERSALGNDGFDVVVAIVPGNDPDVGAPNYLGYYGMGNGGYSSSTSRADAVAVTEIGETLTETLVGVTAGHEVGHKLAGDLYEDPHNDSRGPGMQHPFAQRRLSGGGDRDALWGSRVPTGRFADFVHARHVDSDYDKTDSDDTPGSSQNEPNAVDRRGVVSDGYDLTDGSFEVINGHGVTYGKQYGFEISGGNFRTLGYEPSDYVPTNSLMSYHPKRNSHWPDARLYRYLVDAIESPPLRIRPGVRVEGRIDEDVEVERVDRVPGVPDRREVGRLTVERIDRYDEVIGRSSHSTTLRPHDGDDVEDVVSVFVPDDGRTVWLRLSTPELETRCNAVLGPLRSTVEQLPTDAFVEDPLDARAGLVELLETADEAMREGKFGDAVDPLAEARDRLEDVVDPEFEGGLDDPTREALLEQFSTAIERIRSMAGR